MKKVLKPEEKTMEKIVALCKNRGYVYPGSEIYGGLANTWDFGPLGVEYKNNVKKAWWQKFVQESPYNTGLDCAILMNREVWVASGHVGGFNDPLMDCKACKARFRADKLIEDFTKGAETGDGWTNAELEAYINEHDIVCPVCGKKDFTGISQFNLIIMINSFKSLPHELEEAALIDGLGYWGILRRIIVPLSTAAIATVGLYYAVFFWNDWFNSLIYLNKEQYPVMLFLRNIVNGTAMVGDGAGSADKSSLGIAIKSAVIIVSTLPIIILYPFLQKYFVKGLTVGGVKG